MWRPTAGRMRRPVDDDIGPWLAQGKVRFIPNAAQSGLAMELVGIDERHLLIRENAGSVMEDLEGRLRHDDDVFISKVIRGNGYARFVAIELDEVHWIFGGAVLN